MISIYFGKRPSEDCRLIDNMFCDCLVLNDYDIDRAVIELISIISNPLQDDYNPICYTCNPLILNFLEDDYAKEHVWFIDDSGQYIKMGDDEVMKDKLSWGSAGEICCDDSRILK